MNSEEVQGQETGAGNIPIRTKYNFQKLTPINDADIKVYEDALKFVFENDGIKNVAISGAYSSGKSSVIETFKNLHSEYLFMNISLAHFESTKQNHKNKSSESDDSKKVKEQDVSDSLEYSQAIVEGKIINQMIHQIDREKIPLTNFKVKAEVSTKTIVKITLPTITFCVLSVYIAYFNNWCQFVDLLPQQWIKGLLFWTTNRGWLLVSGVVWTLLFGLAIYSTVKVQMDKNILKKVKLQGNEIEIFENNEESYFDKYLNEVLYLFDNSGADVIVFEDMDRYNVNQIFEKLREINTLVNCKRKKPIRFFYLLRDDIFVSKDRTKFFDFMIPIIPVIDGSNSYDQFIEHFKQGGLFEIFDENFLQGLSLYVDDMRLLKNIYNEFVIYHNRIQDTELNNDKLLAIITYKNTFPKDFNDLQLGMGFVHTLFQSKAEFIKESIKVIDLQIKKLNEDINSTQMEFLNSVDELDAALLILVNQISNVAGKQPSEFKTQTQLIKAIKDNSKTYTSYNSYYNQYKEIDMEHEFNKLIENQDYIKRKEAIERKTNNKIEKLKEEIQQLQNKKVIIQNNRLKDIISKENIDTIFSICFTNEIGIENKFEEIKTSSYFPLIKYLVRNGHIDETYPDYMTYFYENSLTRIDKIFLRSIADEMPKEYSYSLINPELVLSRLRISDFAHEEVLNFDLLSYLLKLRHENNTYLTRFLQQLKETKNYKFIGEFLETRRDVAEFIESINRLWPSIAKCIITESNFGNTQIKQYMLDTLYFSQNEDIKALNQNNCLTSFISESPDFLNISEPIINKIMDGFTLLDVKFKWIEYDVSNKELFMQVYKNNMYQITFNHISLLLEKVYNIAESRDFKTKNYTLISSKMDEPLLAYINNNIDQYVDIILKECDNDIDDEESAVLSIINNTEIDVDKKNSYINFLHIEIEAIANVSDKTLWSLLLQQKTIKYSADNILNYFFKGEHGLDSMLIEFINTSIDDVSFKYASIDNTFGENSAHEFCKSIVTCNELANEKYETILNSLNIMYKSFPYTELRNEKIIILIKNKIIKMTADNLVFMRENYVDQMVLFIIKNIADYTNIIDKDNFDFNEMLLVLEEDIDDLFKIDLLKHTTEKVTIQNKKKYSDEVKIHILKNNFNAQDIPFLLGIFPNENKNLKDTIKEIAVNNIDNIVNEQYIVPRELFSNLLKGMEISDENKKQLLLLFIDDMDREQVKYNLEISGIEEFAGLFDGKRPKIEINSVNAQLLKIFKKRGWVTRFDVDNDSNCYRAIGRKANR